MEINFKTNNLSKNNTCIDYFQSLDTDSIYSVSGERINEIKQYTNCFRNYFISKNQTFITRQDFFQIATEKSRTMHNGTIFLGTGKSFSLNDDGEIELFIVFVTDPNFEYATFYNDFFEKCRNTNLPKITAFKMFRDKMTTYESGFFCTKIIDLELKFLEFLNKNDKLSLIRK